MRRVQGLGCRFSGLGAKGGVNKMGTMTLQLLGYTPIYILIRRNGYMFWVRKFSSWDSRDVAGVLGQCKKMTVESLGMWM